MNLWRPLVVLAFLSVSRSVLTAQARDSVHAGSSVPRLVRWHIADDFKSGIPSWQSYPLAQDIGYDPSIYTTKIAGHSVLRRDVISDGQRLQVIGLIRPGEFQFTAASRLNLVGSLESSGKIRDVKAVLATRDGQTYEAVLPLSPDSSFCFHLDGARFHGLKGQAEIEAVVLSFVAQDAPLGSHSLFTLQLFSIDARRPAEPAIVSPPIITSGSGNLRLANRVVQAGSSAVFTFATRPVNVITEDVEGKIVSGVASIDGMQISCMPGKDAAPGLWTMTVEDGVGKLTFRILVLRARSDHEGILFSSERLQQLRSEDRFRQLRQVIHTEATRRAKQLRFNPEAGNGIALLPSDSVFAGLPAYADLMDSYGSAIAYNALDYRLNDDSHALEITRKALLTVSAWKTWTPPWFVAHGLRTYYVVGVFTQRLALGFDLVSDQLTQAEHFTVEQATMRNSIQPTLDDYYSNQRMPTGASNHMAHSLGGALAAWAAFDRADPDWRSAHGIAFGELIASFDDMLKGLFPGDGSEAEPAGYEVFAMEGVTYGLSSLASLGITPNNAQRVMDSYWWLRYAEVSADLVLDTGDTRATLSSLYSYAWLAEHSSDPGASWFYHSVDRPFLDEQTTRQRRDEDLDASSGKQQVPNPLDLLCCTKPAMQYVPPAPSRIFEQRGSIVLRDRWNDPAMATSIRVGPWMNHEHHDQGSFQIAVHGHLLVGEGGYADYYQDPNYKTYFTQAPAHNVVLVDRDPFSQVSYDGRYWKALSNYPRITASALGDDIDYVEANLEPAYGNSLKSYTRQFLFLKPGLLIVNDKIEAPANHIFSWLLHLAPGAEVQQHDSNMIISEAGSSSSLTVIADDPLSSWQLSNTPIAVNEFTDIDARTVNKRLELSLESNFTPRQRFLVGLSVSGAGEASAIERQQTENGRGFLRRGPKQEAIVLFRDGGGPLRAFGSSTDGSLLAVVMQSSPGGLHLFAADAKSVATGDGEDLSLSIPANVQWDQTGGSVVLEVAAGRFCAVRLRAPIQGDQVQVDGHSYMNVSKSSEISLSPGKHKLEFLLASTKQ